MGGIQIKKVGSVNVNIAGASLAGPTYFNAGDNVGVGTSSPNAKFQVAGGNAYVSTAGNGVILKAPNGTVCAVLTLTNSGTLSTSSVSCP